MFNSGRGLFKDLSSKLTRNTTSGNYIAEIDGLRFIAIAPVVLHHLAERIIRQMDISGTAGSWDHFLFNLLPSGPLGVEIFFVISGFVISMPIIKKWLKQPNRKIKFGFKKYFKRRLTRLEPPYLLVMLTSFLSLLFLTHMGIDTVTSGTQSYSVKSIPLYKSFLASIFYLHGLIFHSYPRLNPLAWSLEIEFQFYVAAPILIIAAIYISKIFKKKHSIVSIFILMVLIFKTFEYLFISGDLQKYLVLDYIQYFFLGFVLCYFYENGRFQKSTPLIYSNLIFISSLIVVYLADRYINQVSPNISLLFELVKIAGIYSIFYASFDGGIGKKFTSNVWISRIGGMCYSMYLIHLIFLQVSVSVLFRIYSLNSFVANLFIYTILLLPILLLVTTLFYFFIEKPCMDPDWPENLLVNIKEFNESFSKSS